MLNPNTGGLSDVRAVSSNDVNDFGRSAIETDEGYLLAGRTWGYGQGQSDLTLAKFDSAGVTCIGREIYLRSVARDWSAIPLNVALDDWSDIVVNSLGEGVVLTPRGWTLETICP